MLTITHKVVNELPPNESFNIKVNLLSRKGIEDLCSTIELIQLPNVDNERLIFLASIKEIPSAPVFFILSDPATLSSTVTLFQLYHNHEFISWSFNVTHIYTKN